MALVFILVAPVAFPSAAGAITLRPAAVGDSVYGPVATSTVTGQLVSPAGVPISDARVSAEATEGDSESGLIAETVTDANGDFVLTVESSRGFAVLVAPEKDYTIAMYGRDGTLKPGVTWENYRSFSPVDGAVHSLGQLRAVAGRTISGTIQVDGLNTVQGARMIFTNAAASWSFSLLLKPGQTSWSLGIPKSDYSIELSSGDIDLAVAASRQVTAGDAPIAGVDFRAAVSPRTFSGEVRSTSGSTGGYLVDLVDLDRTDKSRRQYIAGSHFALGNVQPGRYQLSVMSSGGTTTYYPDFIRAACTEPIVITDTTPSLSEMNVTIGAGSTCAGVPDAPEVSGSVSDGEVTVSWRPPVHDGGSAVTRYTVRLFDSWNAALPLQTWTAQAPGTGDSEITKLLDSLTVGAGEYYWSVSAHNSSGESAESARSTIYIDALKPSAPRDVTAVAGNASITATWQAPQFTSDLPVEYTVWALDSSGGHVSMTTTADTSAVLTGLRNGQAYRVAVTARTSVGTSAEARSSFVIPVNVSGPVTAATAVVDKADVVVWWTTPKDSGGSPITSYSITASPGGQKLTWTGETDGSGTIGVDRNWIRFPKLTSGTEYVFDIVAHTSIGASAPTKTAAVTTASRPGPVSSAGASLTNGRAVVSWGTPSDLGGTPVTAYVVVMNPGSVVQEVPSYLRSATFGALTIGTRYTFEISARNAIGDSQPVTTNPVTPITTPSAPTNVKTVAGDGQVLVTWDAPASTGGADIVGYEVTRVPGDVRVYLDGSGRSTTIAGLTNGSEYRFEVRASNDAGQSFAGRSEAVIPSGIPSAPTNVKAMAGNREVLVTWATPTSTGGTNISEYTVTAEPGGREMVVSGDALSVNFTGLADRVRYKFSVTATNLGGQSPRSAWSEGVVPGAAVSRLAGDNRFATAVAVSAASFEPKVPVVYLANGLDFPDALAGAAAAGVVGAPVLLTYPGILPTEVKAELTRLKPGRIVVLGGAGAVTEKIKKQLAQYTTGSVSRLAGANRFATAVAVSAASFEAKVPVAYVANGLTFPDALAGAAAAGSMGAPVLLTYPGILPTEVKAELTRLKPGRIVVLGGAGAVTEKIKKQLAQYTTGSVSRLAGANRFATAVAVSAASFEAKVPVAYVANGLTFPDALAGAAAAGAVDAPVLLTYPGILPAEVKAELSRLKPGRIVILGGPGAVTQTIRNQLTGYAGQ